ncbi:minor tail protein [Mycobacterium phage Phreeze]|nr:minor tail protein [Mycobacterium phage Phreeze]
MIMNLLPGQYQIGNLVLGKGTNVRVTGFEIDADEVANQDYQRSRQSEKQFGVDQFAPGTITITFNVMKNYIRDNANNPAGLTDEIFKNYITVDQLKKLWRFDEGRQVWGEMMTIYVCGSDGITRAIYGRPGKFAYERRPHDYAGWIECTAEWRKHDTLAYTAQESVVEMTMGEDASMLTRQLGDCDSWFRIVAEGPMDHPVFTVGEEQIELDYNIPAGEIVEISSYPHSRRIITNKRVNLINKMIGKTNYLDRLIIPADKEIPIRWTSNEVNTFVPALGNSSWIEDISDLNVFNLPSTFRNIGGRAVVRLDIFNPRGPRKFLGSGMIGTTSACIYTEKTFATVQQYAQAKIVEPWGGRSGIVIMSDEDMTNYVVLEVVAGPFNDKLRIRTGTAYDEYSEVLDEWDKPTSWRETDIVGIGYDEETNTFNGYFNGDIVVSWEDEDNVVDKDNRHSGMIFDMSGGLLSIGTGFADFMGYDKATVPAETGKAYLLWRDAWSTIR